MIIFKKEGMVTVNHMNYNIEEVNGSNPWMLPWLHQKEPGYKARVWDQESTSPNGVGADMEVNSKFKWLLCACTYLTQNWSYTDIAYRVGKFLDQFFCFLLYNVQ